MQQSSRADSRGPGRLRARTVKEPLVQRDAHGGGVDQLELRRLACCAVGERHARRELRDRVGRKARRAARQRGCVCLPHAARREEQQALNAAVRAEEQHAGRVAVKATVGHQIGPAELGRDEIVHAALGRVALAHDAGRLVQDAKGMVDYYGLAGDGCHGLDARHNLVLGLAHQHTVHQQPLSEDAPVRLLERQAADVGLEEVVESDHPPRSVLVAGQMRAVRDWAGVARASAPPCRAFLAVRRCHSVDARPAPRPRQSAFARPRRRTAAALRRRVVTPLLRHLSRRPSTSGCAIAGLAARPSACACSTCWRRCATPAVPHLAQSFLRAPRARMLWGPTQSPGTVACNNAADSSGAHGLLASRSPSAACRSSCTGRPAVERAACSPTC